MQEESEEAMNKEAVGEFVDSIVIAPERGGVDEKAEGFVWVLRSKNKFLVREGKKDRSGQRWKRKPEYAYMYYRGMMAGGVQKEASCLLSEAKVFDLPLPRRKYNTEVWDVVRCRLVEDVVEEPIYSEAEALIKFNR